MKLIEALQISKRVSAERTIPSKVYLACGFTPLHFETFLAAHLMVFNPTRRIEIETGLFGDLTGNIEKMAGSLAEAGVIAIEWADLDPRLGLRSLGDWSPGRFGDIVDSVRLQTDRLSDLIRRSSIPVAISLPTLPLPPLAYTPRWQSASFDLQLRQTLTSFAAQTSRYPGVRIIGTQRLDCLSPAKDRLDVRSELNFGFPYKLPHASILAEMIARMVYPATPKKGLITDLDNTLWRGILGEDGVERISWDLSQQSQIHGLYQRMLASLSEAGVLLASASKNEPQFVAEAFQREDILVSADSFFPQEIHWGQKSESVRRIISAWNIGADSVVFIDDNPLDVAEVKSAHPDVECIRFPFEDVNEAYDLLERLRDIFGKEMISLEDGIRLDTLRQARAFKDETESFSGSMDDFLEGIEAKLRFVFSKEPADPRAYELVQKTNQFNLNGRRYGAREWEVYLSQPDVFLLVTGYEDKYGPLGKIAVISGRRSGSRLEIDTWVMSCRAFSRRIEFACLRELFDRYGADDIVFDFQPTGKNGPARNFLESLTSLRPDIPPSLSREEFQKRCPQLWHEVLELVNE